MKPVLKRVLITGATGFVGGHLAKACINQGYDVHCIVRPASRPLEPSISNSSASYSYSGSISEMQKILIKAKPDVVLHTAANFVGTHNPEDISPLIESNITLGTHLVESMMAAGVTNLVTAATSWQHLDDWPYKPVNLYAATKQAFESILEYYVDAAELKVINLSLFDTYGPGDTRAKLIPLLQKAVKENTVLEMSAGQQIVDLVHVSDIVAGFLIAARQLANGQVQGTRKYCLNAEKRYSLEEVIHLVQDVYPGNLQVNFGALAYGPRQVMEPWTKGIRLPDWAPKVDLKSGLAQLFSEADHTKN